MSGWTRAACSACALAACLVAAGCGAGEVTLVVERANEDVPRPGALRVLFQIIGETDPLIFQTVPVDDPAIDQRRFADVRPGSAVYADVLGCTDENSCAEEGPIARGCSDRFRLDPGESREVTVVLDLPDVAAVRCDEVASGP